MMRVAADFLSRWRCCTLQAYDDDLAVQSHGRFLEQVRQLATAYEWLARAIDQRLKLIIARDKQHGIGSSALVRATPQTQLRPRGVRVAATAKFLGDYSAGGAGPRKVQGARIAKMARYCKRYKHLARSANTARLCRSGALPAATYVANAVCLLGACMEQVRRLLGARSGTMRQVEA